jgi:hypothetical protein
MTRGTIWWDFDGTLISPTLHVRFSFVSISLRDYR